MTAVSREVLVANQRGLHARASAKFVNLASQPLLEQVNNSSAAFGPDVDEAAELGISLEPSDLTARTPARQAALSPRPGSATTAAPSSWARAASPGSDVTTTIRAEVTTRATTARVSWMIAATSSSSSTC